MNQNILESFGWDSFFEEQAVENFEVGRILLEHKHIYRIICNDGEYMAELSGKFRHEAVTKGDYPAVGDWVYIKKIEDEKKAIIHRIFPAKKLFLKTRGWNKNRRTDYSSKCRLFIFSECT